MSEAEIPKDTRWTLLWNVRLGIRYHMHLQNYYERFGKIVTACSLILSTSAGASLFGSHIFLAKILAFATAVLQVIELVIDSKSKAFLHTELRRRYIQLESELVVKGKLENDEYIEYQNRLSSIELDEPPIIYSLVDSCNNELVKVCNCDKQYLQKLNPLKWLISKWYS